MFENFFNPSTKFLIHCLSLLAIILFSAHQFLDTKNLINKSDHTDFDPLKKYGIYWTYLLCFIRFSILLVFPQVLSNFFGLILYNPFKSQKFLEKVPQDSSSIAFICFRVVTKGEYPNLVDRNVKRNIKTCLDAGFNNFSFEIATDRPLNLTFSENKVREIVIPESYKTKTNAMFKVKILRFLCYYKLQQILFSNIK